LIPEKIREINMSANYPSQPKVYFTALGLAVGLVPGGIKGLAIGSALDNRRLEDDS